MCNPPIQEPVPDGQFEGELNLIKFKGTILNGRKNGLCTLDWPDGQRFDGNFKNGIIEGYGVYYYANKGKYEGEWKNNLYHGKGKLTLPHYHVHKGSKTLVGFTSYSGEFVNGKKHGHGIYIWVNGAGYEGEWKDDRNVSKLRSWKK